MALVWDSMFETGVQGHLLSLMPEKFKRRSHDYWTGALLMSSVTVPDPGQECRLYVSGYLDDCWESEDDVEAYLPRVMNGDANVELYLWAKFGWPQKGLMAYLTERWVSRKRIRELGNTIQKAMQDTTIAFASLTPAFQALAASAEVYGEALRRLQEQTRTSTVKAYQDAMRKHFDAFKAIRGRAGPGADPARPPEERDGGVREGETEQDSPDVPRLD